MISGNDIHEISQKLAILAAIGPEEARCRSAISRAYYAAFHWAKDFLHECGVEITTDASGHEEAKRYIFQCGLPNCESIGRRLGDLRRARNDADYMLSRAGFESCMTARIWIEAADKVKSILQQWLQDKPTAQAAIGKLKASPQFRK